MIEKKEVLFMEKLLEWMEYMEDVRQTSKVRHKLKDILVIVLFATLTNADDWVGMQMFALAYEDYLKQYIELKNGVPSHDTISRVMGMLSSEVLQQLYNKWQELLNRNEGEKKEYHYYISSLKEDIKLFSRAVRGDWSVKSMHWHLDVTFKEDGNATLEKQAAMNQNIIRKWCLSILKMMDLYRKKLSMKKKRFLIGLKPMQYLEEVLKN